MVVAISLVAGACVIGFFDQMTLKPSERDGTYSMFSPLMRG
jgi:hypothetical protein